MSQVLYSSDIAINFNFGKIQCLIYLLDRIFLNKRKLNERYF